MNNILTIKGQPVIDIYESFNGSYWFVVERAFTQDSFIDGKIYRRDQIFFGYVRLSSCPEFAEFGYFSEAELKLLGHLVWKVPRKNWSVCPEVEVKSRPQELDKKDKGGCEIEVPQPFSLRLCEEVAEK
jgi:hypothetical protein